MDWWVEILKAVITGGLAFLGVIFANRKSQALVEYRLTQVEKKLDIHNSVIDRTYRLEEDSKLHDAELKRQNERLKILEANR